MRAKYITFAGREYCQNSEGYYRNSLGGKKRILHRDIYELHCGEIPEGYVIHHIDHNKENNDISNLQCMTSKAHIKHHREGVFAGQEKAIEWHGSAEGKAWHSAHGRKSWENRTEHEVTCKHCGDYFFTPFPSRAKFCSDTCKSKARYARDKLKKLGAK